MRSASRLRMYKIITSQIMICKPSCQSQKLSRSVLSSTTSWTWQRRSSQATTARMIARKAWRWTTVTTNLKRRNMRWSLSRAYNRLRRWSNRVYPSLMRLNKITNNNLFINRLFKTPSKMKTSTWEDSPCRKGGMPSWTFEFIQKNKNSYSVKNP